MGCIIKMRFTLTSIFLIIAGFIFLAVFSVSSLLLTETSDALSTVDTGLPSGYTDIKNLLPSAFGIIGAIFLVCGIVLVFLLDSLADENEYYYEENNRYYRR